MIRVKYFAIFYVFILMVSCQKQEDIVAEVCFSEPAISINDVTKTDQGLCFASGDTWEEGFVHLVTDQNCDKNESLSVNALLAADYDQDRIYSVGMNNNVWRFEDDQWTEFVIDSNLVMRDIESTPDHLLLTGGLSFFQGYIQIVDKVGFKVTESFRFEQQLNTVICNDKGSCIAAGYGAIYFSDDVGYSWQFTEHQGDHFMSATVDEFGDFYILGSSGLVLKTSDGKDYEVIKNGNGIAGNYRDLVFLNDELILVGEQGKIVFVRLGSNEQSIFSIGKEHDILCVDAIGDTVYLGTRQGEILKVNI